MQLVKIFTETHSFVCPILYHNNKKHLHKSSYLYFTFHIHFMFPNEIYANLFVVGIFINNQFIEIECFWIKKSSYIPEPSFLLAFK